MKKIILASILSLNIYSQQMEILKKGQPAPFDGILSDSEQMKEFRQINETNKLLQQQNLELKNLSILHNEKIDLYKNGLNAANLKLEKSERYLFWSNIGYFTLGVLVTGIAAKAAIEVVR